MPTTTSPDDSLETLIERARAFIEEGDHRQAILCLRRAQAQAPFRADIREMLSEAIDGRLAASPARLDADFGAEGFARTIETRHGARPRRHRHRSFLVRWGFTLMLTFLVLALVGAIALATYQQPPPAAPAAVTPAPVAQAPEAAAPTAPVPPTIRPEELLEEARAKLQANQFEDALALLDEAMALGPEDPAPVRALYAEVYQARGRHLFDAGRYEEAQANYSRAAEFTPEAAPLYYSMGWCNYYMAMEARQAGDDTAAREAFEVARDLFQRSIEIDPNLAMSHRSLGQVLFQLGDREGAFSAWRRTIQLDPNGENGERARRFLQSHGMRVD